MFSKKRKKEKKTIDNVQWLQHVFNQQTLSANEHKPSSIVWLLHLICRSTLEYQNNNVLQHGNSVRECRDIYDKSTELSICAPHRHTYTNTGLINLPTTKILIRMGWFYNWIVHTIIDRILIIIVIVSNCYRNFFILFVCWLFLFLSSDWLCPMNRFTSDWRCSLCTCYARYVIVSNFTAFTMISVE